MLSLRIRRRIANITQKTPANKLFRHNPSLFGTAKTEIRILSSNFVSLEFGWLADYFGVEDVKAARLVLRAEFSNLDICESRLGVLSHPPVFS